MSDVALHPESPAERIRNVLQLLASGSEGYSLVSAAEAQAMPHGGVASVTFDIAAVATMRELLTSAFEQLEAVPR